ncbi:MAG: hypothetical protein JWO97_2911 [Acidobacteria bacterium]|nr:hypothetical protein [Acidobacteriota bacterium]
MSNNDDNRAEVPSSQLEGADQRTGVAVTSFAELLYLSTIRVLAIHTTEASPRAGSAFVVSHKDVRFLVSAAHLVRDAESMTIHLYTAVDGPRFGTAAPYQIRREDDFWHFHSDPDIDIAVGAFDPVADFLSQDSATVTVNAISTDDFVTPWEKRTATFTDPFWHPLPLDEVLLVGYPDDYRDRETSLPLLRRGRLATPIWLNHENRPVFLIDTYAGCGTSGGPVAYVEEKHHVGRTMYGDTGKIVLLGVFSEKLPAGRQVAIQDGRPGHPPNLGAAYKAHLIMEIIESL